MGTSWRMKELMMLNSRILFIASVAFVSHAASAQFDTASLSEAIVTATTVVDEGAGPVQVHNGGTFSPIYPFFALSPSSSQGGMFGTAAADAFISVMFAPTRIVASGSVNSDTDGFGEKGGAATASAVSSMVVRFSISEPHRWRFNTGSLNGVHAGGSVSLYIIGPPPPGVTAERSAPTFYFDSISNPDFSEESGEIGPATYQFSAEISTYTNSDDGFGGLFGGASFDFDFEILPLAPPDCPGDADGNGEVNFADITNVLTNFGADYSSGTGPGDADRNGVVNFADITNVLTNFGAVCR